MSNQNQILDRVKKTNQPLIIVSSNPDGWHDLIGRLVCDMKIQPPDIITFSEEEGVKQLRQKINLLSLKPHSSESRIFVIYSVDELNREQTNTLLKTLEEPPSYGRIILFAQTLSRILETIKSRCQKVFISSESSVDDLSLLKYFERLQFNEFLHKLSETDNGEIPQAIKSTLDEMKNRGLNKDETELYKKLSLNLIRFACTNVNRKLALEQIFIWWKASREK